MIGEFEKNNDEINNINKIIKYVKKKIQNIGIICGMKEY